MQRFDHSISVVLAEDYTTGSYTSAFNHVEQACQVSQA